MLPLLWVSDVWIFSFYPVCGWPGLLAVRQAGRAISRRKSFNENYSATKFSTWARIWWRCQFYAMETSLSEFVLVRKSSNVCRRKYRRLEWGKKVLSTVSLFVMCLRTFFCLEQYTAEVHLYTKFFFVDIGCGNKAEATFVSSKSICKRRKSFCLLN